MFEQFNIFYYLCVLQGEIVFKSRSCSMINLFGIWIYSLYDLIESEEIVLMKSDDDTL